MSALIGIVCNRREDRVAEAEVDRLCATYESLRGALAHTTSPAGGSRAFASSARQSSELGLSVFLRAGYQFGTRTIWEGIERLDPATRIVFGPNGARRDTYWRPPVEEEVTRLSLAEAVERCRTVARETLGSSYAGTEGRRWADLTGGYDSRLSTLLFTDAGVDFIANTFGREGSEDVVIAAEIARAAGWDWRRFDIPAAWPELLPRLMPQAAASGTATSMPCSSRRSCGRTHRRRKPTVRF
jgi:hypothetical protein